MYGYAPAEPAAVVTRKPGSRVTGWWSTHPTIPIPRRSTTSRRKDFIYDFKRILIEINALRMRGSKSIKIFSTSVTALTDFKAVWQYVNPGRRVIENRYHIMITIIVSLYPSSLLGMASLMARHSTRIGLVYLWLTKIAGPFYF